MKERDPVLRRPAVAGRFYSADPDRLRQEVARYVVGSGKEEAIGILSPHAGLMYSGHVAGAVYSSILSPETYILVGPNHTGLGAPVSLMSSGAWEMPMGSFAVDGELGRMILQEVPFAAEDLSAHLYEHSLEVQLPFIGYFSPSAKILPLTIMTASLEECRELGAGIARA
ncbi:MAG: AmmeMemoRadiSam system protein B, partial [Thermodesulfovibrionales bacterium]